MSDRTAHLAALCPNCNAAFVVFTFPHAGSPIEPVTNRMSRATCPDCGNCSGLKVALNADHARAVARLRAEAALD